MYPYPVNVPTYCYITTTNFKAEGKLSMAVSFVWHGFVFSHPESIHCKIKFSQKLKMHYFGISVLQLCTTEDGLY